MYNKDVRSKGLCLHLCTKIDGMYPANYYCCHVTFTIADSHGVPTQSPIWMDGLVEE